MLALVIGGFLRFWNLGGLPFWCDEAFFATNIYRLEAHQEYLPGLIAHIFGVSNEFWTRFPFALAGTLTIAAVYWVKPSRWSALVSLFVAVFPLFVMYSRMCRPYSMAGLFLAVSWKMAEEPYPPNWRFRWIAYLAGLCTPTAFIGIDFIRLSRFWKFGVVLVVFMASMLFMREDLDRPGFLTLQMFINSPRLWYVPLLALVLYFTFYLLPWMLNGLKKNQRSWFEILLTSTLIAASAGFLVYGSLEIPSFRTGPALRTWYTSTLYYNDWRGMRPVDLATNFSQISEYYTGKSSVLLRRAVELTADRTALTDERKIDSLLNAKDTVFVGVDSYANNTSAWFFPKRFLWYYGDRLLNGEVVLARLRRVSPSLRVMEVLDKQTLRCSASMGYIKW